MHYVLKFLKICKWFRCTGLLHNSKLVHLEVKNLDWFNLNWVENLMSLILTFKNKKNVWKMVKIKLFSKNAHMHLSKVKGCKRGQNSTGRSKRVFYSDIFLTYKCKLISSKAFHKVILVLVILLYVLIFFKCRYFHCGGLLHSSKLVHLNREARLVLPKIFCET